MNKIFRLYNQNKRSFLACNIYSNFSNTSNTSFRSFNYRKERKRG